MIGRADVVVIGGGIVGAACAYYLCVAGLDVHVVERRFPASGTSRACDGLVLAWDKTGTELQLGQASAALWAELSEALDRDFEYARKGSILLAETEAELDAARGVVQAMDAARIRAETLDGAGLRSLEPNLASDLAGGAFFPDDAQVDARRATLALLSAAQERGLTIHTDAQVMAIQRTRNETGNISAVISRNGKIWTPTVVCAAGAWSSHVARLVGIEVPIRPRKGHILVTGKIPGLIRHPLLEGGYTHSVRSASEDLGVAFVAEMTAGGTLLLGSSRQFLGFDRSVSLPVIQAIASRAVRFLPSLANKGVKVIRSYAGLRPWSPDHLPLIGPVTAVPGFYVATGHEGAGISLAPITGHLIADWIIGADLPTVAAEIKPDRFALVDTAGQRLGT